jgi:hypothetical protein
MEFEELAPEREEEIAEKIAQTAVKKRMAAPLVLFIESVKPLAFVASQLAIFSLGPLYALLGQRSEEYTMFFSKRENVERVLKRVEELSKSQTESS